jgi:translation initiation factor 2B subunit (eIF-2B alpha/beta/delta family)
VDDEEDEEYKGHCDTLAEACEALLDAIADQQQKDLDAMRDRLKEREKALDKVQVQALMMRTRDKELADTVRATKEEIVKLTARRERRRAKRRKRKTA